MVETERHDVIIIGAGLSGIGAACHLQQQCPDRSYVIVEARDDIGGTWDLFRYPGVRSDSDMHTLGFEFKPWTAATAIADGPAILRYLRETVAEHGIESHIRFGQRATAASWSTDDSTWTVDVHDRARDAHRRLVGNFVLMCSGYYSYRGGHTPDFPGRERYRGTVVHPQDWPEDLDYEDTSVVVIGSGATAVTLVPAMADKAAHITMLQRSPTYLVSRPDHDVIATTLRKFLPDQVAYTLTRYKNVALGELFYRWTRTRPEKVKQHLLGLVRKELGDGYDIDTHFTPHYDPWDQRLCLVPNSDFFAAVRSGKASVVTDHIRSWTETGLELESGRHLEADIIVTATGLRLVTPGEMDFFVDGDRVDFSRTWTYKGLGYSDIPNLVSTFGYINASWTLRADLIANYVCRLLQHMRQTGTTQATPRLRASDRDMPARPFIEGFSSGYLQRSMAMLPRQGDREPWVATQSYPRDRRLIGRAAIDDGVMQFTSAPTRRHPGDGAH